MICKSETEIFLNTETGDKNVAVFKFLTFGNLTSTEHLDFKTIITDLMRTTSCEAEIDIWEDALVAEGPFPVIIKDHGNGSLATERPIGNLMNLVRQGYIVAAVDHAGGSFNTQIGLIKQALLDDGRITSDLANKITPEGIYPFAPYPVYLFLPQRVEARTKDDVALVDALGDINNGIYAKVYEPDAEDSNQYSSQLAKLAGHIDIEKLGILGDSYGGVTVIESIVYGSNAVNTLFDAAISNGAILPSPNERIFTIPMMAIAGNQDESFLPGYLTDDPEDPLPNHREFLLNLAQAPNYYALIRNADHFSMFLKVSDLWPDMIPDVLYKESVYDIDNRYELINHKVVSDIRNFFFQTWFDVYLKGKLCPGTVFKIRESNGSVIEIFPVSMHNLSRLTATDKLLDMDVVQGGRHNDMLVTTEIQQMLTNIGALSIDDAKCDGTTLIKRED